MTAILPDIPSDQYHADALSDTPTLSASIAHTLVSRSPAHAKAAHPRLNPDFQREDKTHFDIGSVVHSLLLEGKENVHVIFQDDYRKKIAQEDRDFARAHGRIPLLAHQRDEVYAMVDAINRGLDRHKADPRPFTDGAAEVTITWDEDGVACRARLDWLRSDMGNLDDCKTASNANPDRWTRSSIYDHGYDVRCAFHLRGVEKTLNGSPEWRWIVIEKSPPYELCVVSPGSDVLALANAKVDRAIRLWRECMETGEWPGYPDEVCIAELPPWEEARWLEKEAREELAA